MAKLFISYSWDSIEHEQMIIGFTNYLRSKGFDAVIDKMLSQEETAIDFVKMMHKAMHEYSKVVVVLSKGYKEKAENFIGGVGEEYEILINDIKTNPQKYILLSFKGRTNEIVPLGLKGRDIIDFSKPDGEEELFSKLLDHKKYVFAEVASETPKLKTIEINVFRFKKESSRINLNLKEKSQIDSILKNESIKLLNENGLNDEISIYPMSKLISVFSAKGNEIEVHIKNRFKLKYTTAESREFTHLNKQRHIPQFEATRYRLLGAPTQKSGQIILQVAPFDFATFAILRDSKNKQLIDEIKTRLNLVTDPTHLIKDVGPRDLVPIGIEILLITKDKKLLLRRRGTSVQTEKNKWDVSISGYVGNSDLDPNDPSRIDLCRTANEELLEEIKSHNLPLNANPSDVEFLGLHHNLETGATDILGCWHIDVTSKELKSMITNKRTYSGIFPTTKKTKEVFVRDTNNYIIDFNKIACKDAINEIHLRGDRFMAEAFMCLILAMKRYL